jgi:hypothetical protein
MTWITGCTDILACGNLGDMLNSDVASGVGLFEGNPDTLKSKVMLRLLWMVH